jgi:type 1 glutamine amidotransferase
VKPFRFSEDKRPHVAILMAEDEYKTEQSLPPFALPNLGPDFKLSYIYSDEKGRNTLPGIEALNDADVAIISVRRRLLPREQLDVVRKFIAAGKPIIGIRTASHAFAPRPNEKVPEGHDAWLTFDPDVLGGHYTGHHGVGPRVTIAVASGAEQHAILKGIDVAKLLGNGSLYKSAPLAKSATAILTGTVPDKPAEPIAWINTRADGGKTFYTSLGHIDDFAEPAFRQLLVNAVKWAVAK